MTTAERLIEHKLKDVRYEYSKEDTQNKADSEFYWRIRFGKDKIARSNETFTNFNKCKDDLIEFVSKIKGDERKITREDIKFVKG